MEMSVAHPGPMCGQLPVKLASVEAATARSGRAAAVPCSHGDHDHGSLTDKIATRTNFKAQQKQLITPPKAQPLTPSIVHATQFLAKPWL